MANSTLFVGGIVPTASVEKIEDEFKKFGECSCSFPSKVRFILRREPARAHSSARDHPSEECESNFEELYRGMMCI